MAGLRFFGKLNVALYQFADSTFKSTANPTSIDKPPYHWLKTSQRDPDSLGSMTMATVVAASTLSAMASLASPAAGQIVILGRRC